MIQENVNARNKFQIIVLSVKFDTNLTYCNEGSQEIFALSKVASYMSLSKRCILMNVLFSSQFNYCLLVWMCHHSATNGKINRLHERCLRRIYNDKHLTNGLSPHLVSNIINPPKIVTLTIYELILRFPDSLLGLYFTGPRYILCWSNYLGHSSWSLQKLTWF